MEGAAGGMPNCRAVSSFRWYPLKGGLKRDTNSKTTFFCFWVWSVNAPMGEFMGKIGLSTYALILQTGNKGLTQPWSSSGSGSSVLLGPLVFRGKTVEAWHVTPYCLRSTHTATNVSREQRWTSTKGSRIRIHSHIPLMEFPLSTRPRRVMLTLDY